jgi:hypothetical protein
MSTIDLNTILGACWDETELTSYPYFIICILHEDEDDGRPRKELLAGIWFVREDAEAYLRDHRGEFPDEAEVYSMSGHRSPKWRALLDAVKPEGWPA